MIGLIEYSLKLASVRNVFEEVGPSIGLLNL